MSDQQFHIELIHRISNPNDIVNIKKQVSDYHDYLRESFAKQPINKIILGRAFYIDCLIRHLWKSLELEQYKDLSLIAVGGYGRGHLNLHSDIDLLILYKSSIKPEVKTLISQFITLLWDIGLDVGQSVRSIKETITLAKGDITIATNLLEARIVAGCDTTFAKLEKEIGHRRFWPSDKFFTEKRKEQRERHAKFNGTSYNLEPNIKENPGGLRDIQMIGWVAKKHFNVADGNDLVKKDFLQPQELLELQECRQFLWKIRCALHIVAKRSENRLLFEYQTDVAKLLNYGDEGKASVEKMMKEYFVVARRISELNQMLLQYFSEAILEPINPKRCQAINENYDLYNDLIVLKNPQALETPTGLLHLFHVIADNPQIKGLHSMTLRQLRMARRFYEHKEEQLAEHIECQLAFKQLIKHPNFFDSAWDLMHQHGIMAIYTHYWAHIVGLMQFDLFHAYTVDEHTHRLIKNIYRYTQFEFTNEFPRCSSICNDFPRMDLLYLAAIFHDICKGKNGDHSKLGAVAVREFMTQHGYAEIDIDLVAWLVDNHLEISVVSQRKDINDPQVINEFADLVEDEIRLNLLYALTLADIRATNKSLYNQWKASLMRELYTCTLKVLRTGQRQSLSQSQRIQQRKADTIELLENTQVSDQQFEQFWQSMGDEYHLRHKPAQIAWHCEQISASTDNQPIIKVHNDLHKGGTTVFVYCKDRPFLFSGIASNLAVKNFNVHAAMIFSSDQGMAVDSFIILEDDGTLVDNERSQDAIRAVENAINCGEDFVINERIPRKMKQFNVPTKVFWLDSDYHDRTLMELEALDTPGLLAKIGRVFLQNNVTLHSAKVATIGERAEDFFVLSDDEGNKLSDEQKRILSEQIKQELKL
ncbi:[protein-PII] uridylyltransferase [Saccharobesus litoralis]|uniref:Bifunctional uridylyltransferase/uridylyl-removing enzyme n=1 Tax=Saccharobesus litoralis TaxID=2172099 RepID=A0A2S0VVF3_9ALTE|nr:[protein-PII] uridylyltransferase [Saccharobesus litoralis]AWB68152.1 [protein-PII] uridylyltransferase [Saccharobesus litoralis]